MELNLKGSKIFIEVKFHSGKSGEGEHDQLANQYEDLCESISKKRVLIYLTKHRLMPLVELNASVLSMKNYNPTLEVEFKENLYWLSWFDIWQFIDDKLKDVNDRRDHLILEDILDLLEKQNLKHFTGFSKTKPIRSIEPIVFYHG